MPNLVMQTGSREALAKAGCIYFCMYVYLACKVLWESMCTLKDVVSS